MNYVRTKDNRIIDVSNYKDAVSLQTISNLVYGNERHVYLYQGVEIVKYADTLTDLINRFIIKRRTTYKILTQYQFGKIKVSAIKNLIENGAIILGAIWAGEGLIYKAKMKGILPNGEIDWELL